MAYSWKDNLPDGGALPENSAGDPLATLTADDGTTDAVSYGIGDGSDGYGKYLFEIDNNGVLSPKTLPADYLDDYEDSILVQYRADRLFTATVNAYSAEGEVVASRLFVLTLQDVDEFETEWVGTPFAGGSIAENNPENYGPVVFNANDGDGTADVTYSLSGDDVDYFSLNANTGEFYLKSSLDFEDTDHGVVYSVTVNATPTDDGAAISQTVIVTVTDVDEGVEWETNPTGNAGEVLENIAVGTALATFSATDPEGEGSVYGLGAYFPAFGLDGGSQGKYFSMDIYTGVLTTNSELDFENTDIANGYYTLNVLSQASPTDEKPLGTEVISHIFILTLGDVADETLEWVAPASTEGRELAENNPATTTSIANFGAIDTVDNTPLTYSLSGTDSADFAIDAATGELSISASFDFEDSAHANGLYSVIITATATDGTSTPAISRRYVLTITDVDERIEWKTTPTGNADVVSEGIAIDTVLATFVSTDPEGAESYYGVGGDYGFIGGHQDEYFSLDLYTGELITKAELNYEDTNIANGHYTILALSQARDKDLGVGVISHIFVLTLTDIDNESPKWSSTPPTGTTFAENNDVDFGPIPFNATEDGGATVTYSLSGTDAAYFSIDADNGGVYAASSFDFEDSGHTDGLYSVTVNATATDDANTPVLSHIFVLTITNVDEPVEWTTTQNGTVTAENARSSNLGAFAAIDLDSADITYGIRADHLDSEYFQINATTGLLSMTKAINFEARPPEGDDERSHYSVVVQANAVNNDASDRIEHTYILSIRDVAESSVWAETGNAVALTKSSTIAENNTAGGLITVFSAYDEDIGTTISYSLLDIYDDDYFSINSETGQIYALSSFDFEDTNHDNVYRVLVQADSSDSTVALTGDFYLTISNVNEFATTWENNGNPTGNTLPERTASGTSLADFGATDGDSGTTVTYSVAADLGDGSYFEIDSTSGVLTTKSYLNFENPDKTDGFYSVLVRANSTDGGAINQVFVLTVTNVPEESFWAENGGLNLTKSETIAENNTVGGLLAVFSARDGDSDTITYSFSGGAETKYFSLNHETGQLYAVSSFDFENPHPYAEYGNVYNVGIIATSSDDNQSPLGGDFYLTISNVNEFTTGWENNGNPVGNTISENLAIGTSLADFNATDGDGETTVTYSVAADLGDGSYFAIDSASGVLTAKSIFDFENPDKTDGRYSVLVRANSDDGSAINQVFVLTIADVDGAGLAPDPTTPDQPVGLNGKILFDGDTETIGGINDGIGNDGLVIIGDDLSATQYDSVSATNTDLVLNNIENFADSFVGYTDADGNTQNHWFFVRDDAGDNTGHIVFDADGLDVNLESFANGGATTTPDQINLLAGLNFGNDGDFAKPDDLNLDLNGNNAAALTHDQFLALIGGSNNIDFI